MAAPKADPAALAARSLPRLPGERVLLVDVPGGAAAGTLRPAPDARFHWFSTDWPAHLAIDALGHRCHFGPWIGTGEAEGDPWDAALVFLPKGRERIRMTLAMVSAALPVGSPLWVVGAGRAGIESAADDLADFADLRSVEIGKRSRLLMATTRTRPDVSLDDFLSTWALPLPGRTLAICSFPGVFSHGRLDEGTELILSAVGELPAPRLDVGCGAGVIGAAYADASAATGDTVLVDADALAVVAGQSAATTFSYLGPTITGHLPAAGQRPARHGGAGGRPPPGRHVPEHRLEPTFPPRGRYGLRGDRASGARGPGTARPRGYAHPGVQPVSSGAGSARPGVRWPRGAGGGQPLQGAAGDSGGRTEWERAASRGAASPGVRVRGPVARRA